MSDDRSQLLNDQEQAMRELLDGRQVGIWTALPGIIQSVDNAAMTVTVQPAVKGVIVGQDGQQRVVSLPLLLDVPIVFPSGGGFIITFPIQEGDEVLVVFSSRCIDAWWQSGGEQQAMEARMHDLSDGFAIPGPRSIPNKISNFNNNKIQIRNDSGLSFFEIDGPDNDGVINIQTPVNIRLQAATIQLHGDVEISGNLEVVGESLLGGKTFSTHTHSGVTTGGGNTGPPT